MRHPAAPGALAITTLASGIPPHQRSRLMRRRPSPLVLSIPTSSRQVARTSLFRLPVCRESDVRANCLELVGIDRTNGDGPDVTFSATGLPSWAQLDPNSGILSGTPKK